MPPKKNLISQLKGTVTQYNNAVNKCEAVLKGKRYEKYEPTLNKLEDRYDQLCENWEAYRDSILEKGTTVEEFNAKKPPPNDDSNAFTHNDAWKEEKEKSFMDLFDKVMINLLLRKIS